jgi:hypothetical protein
MECELELSCSVGLSVKRHPQYQWLHWSFEFCCHRVGVIW